MKNRSGFVVSAILYPLLVLFLALIMGLLSMTDTRKRILDKMKLEISDSIFDEATCSCDTILNKLNYIIKNGTGGGGGGSYEHNALGLKVTAYETPSQLPTLSNNVGDIGVITSLEITNYYVSNTPPNDPKEGTVWVVQDLHSAYYVVSDYSKIGISYVMQYENGKWQLKKSYVFDDARWKLLYYVELTDSVYYKGNEYVYDYGYTGKYQKFFAPFSGYYQVELWGASGGRYADNDAYNKIVGKGAYTKGEVYLNAGDELYLYVGGQGSLGHYDATLNGQSSSNYISTGGWNGGGYGTYYDTNHFGNGGGGATDIRLVATKTDTTWNDFDSLKSRIMVAGGGAGTAYISSAMYASGSGGTLSGNNGYRNASDLINHGGTYGATQTSGGKSAIFVSDTRYTGENGSFGTGGHASYYHNSGGGGGYYGGGGGSRPVNAGYSTGSGGSSYISGYNGTNSVAQNSTADNIIHTGSAYHYSNYFFKNGNMKSGENLGNGKAKISLKTVEVKTSEDIQKEIVDRENTWTYTYSGDYQVFTAPFDGTYKMELNGASGGSFNTDAAYSVYAGKGASTSGNIYLKAGTKLYIYVGGQGGQGYYDASGSSGESTCYSTGGWNGGGYGQYYDTNNYGQGGGGATDIRLASGNWDDFDSLKSRIMVAAGGGGSMYISAWFYGGDGGGLKGSDGHNNNATVNFANGSIGGSQSMGGLATMRPPEPRHTGTNGGFGYAGHASYYRSSGGGSGYFGGGGGGHNVQSYVTGAGGSSYISGYAGCDSVDEKSTISNLILTGDSYHYSGKYFTNTTMVAGDHYGDGKAVITLVSKQNTASQNKNNEYHFDYSGGYQVFTVPVNGTYHVELLGASSGSYDKNAVPIAFAGKGGKTTGDIYLTAGTKLYIYVGGQGGSNYYNASGSSYYSTYYSTGGYNGGGDGTYYDTNNFGQGGGGATDIRLVAGDASSFDSLKSRIMVAGGGGGGSLTRIGETNVWLFGGDGGGLVGGNGNRTDKVLRSTTARGGSQTKGGAAGYHTDPNHVGEAGQFGIGGNAAFYYYGGGGGGYYGGGGGSNNTIDGATTGAGGSSYISGYEGSNSIAQNSSKTNIVHTGSPYHYSGKYFSSGSMESGVNFGNGSASIKLVSTADTTKKDVDTYTFTYSGSYQEFTVPKNGTYHVETVGASGGYYRANEAANRAFAGKGGKSSGDIYLTAGTKLYVYVGSQGGNAYRNAEGGKSSTGYYSTGGYNGGGNGTFYNTSNFGLGGGGATDIRLVPGEANSFDSLKSRIMVAGGGSGTLYVSNIWYYGSNGGGLVGDHGHYTLPNDSFRNVAEGGSQTKGGRGALHVTDVNHNGDNGTFGIGGDAEYYYSSGGGGGYYGGGGGGNNRSYYTSGAGGSSYISGYPGCNSVDETSTLNNILHTGSAYHYSGKYFANAKMEQGTNEGDGYATITFVSATDTTTKENTDTYEFSYSGSYQKFTAPSTGYYNIELWGAAGGTYEHDDTWQALIGRGAYTSGKIYLAKGTQLYLYVGGKGGYGTFNDNKSTANTVYQSLGGWNGGGNGQHLTDAEFGTGGGGATDVRLTPTNNPTLWNDETSLKSRIMVAAAGSGAGQFRDGSTDYVSTGSSGGGLVGYDGRYRRESTTRTGAALGGTQIAGGIGVNGHTDANWNGAPGGFGIGGNGAYYETSGGGSGWYGGGGGGRPTGNVFINGAGGSSYISGHAGCIGVNSAGSPLASAYAKLENSYSYTGYKFTDTVMIDGDGYRWTTTKQDTAGTMPNYNSTDTMTGNKDNGYARISYLGA